VVLGHAKLFEGVECLRVLEAVHAQVLGAAVSKNRERELNMQGKGWVIRSQI
jgi:hypothetical protein